MGEVVEWIEVKIKTKSEAVELVTGLLLTNNIPNVRIIDDVEVERFLLDHPLNWDYKDNSFIPREGAEIIFYVQDDEIGRGLLSSIEDSLHELVKNIDGIDFGNLKIDSGPVNDDDWLHEWKKTYKPFAIGNKIVVRPFWEEYIPKNDEIVFAIDPGAVFGTGLHATTQLCILAMEKIDLSNKSVLDVGCGSGILSIIALLLGAKDAIACDIDPSAVRSASENARLNDIDCSRFNVLTGDLSVINPDANAGKFDIVLANIVADVIIEISPTIKNILKADGIFIASGIIDDREDDVKTALTHAGFEIKDRIVKEGWVSLVL